MQVVCFGLVSDGLGVVGSFIVCDTFAILFAIVLLLLDRGPVVSDFAILFETFTLVVLLSRWENRLGEVLVELLE